MQTGGQDGALAQFRLMSGQLEVHHSALCTSPVSPNLCCRGLVYPQSGLRSNAKRYCDEFTLTLHSNPYNNKAISVCVQSQKRKGEMTWSRDWKEKNYLKKIAKRMQNLSLLFSISSPLILRCCLFHPFPSHCRPSLQILVFVFVGTTACGYSVGGLLRLLIIFGLQDLSEEPEDGVKTGPGGQIVSLRAYV